MKISDLGVLSGPVVLWGGALGNRAALAALEDEIASLGVPPDHVISTGDLAGYCAEGAECLRRVQARGWPVVAGNVEQGLAAGAVSCGCGFATGSTCDRLSAPWWLHALRSADAALRAWMAGLPDVILFEQAGRRHAVIHGGLTDVSRFLWPVSRQPEFAEEIAAIEAAVGPVDAVVAGHCGIGFQRVVAGRRWINAGSIGMPPNNGVPGGQYVLLDAGGAHLRRLSYDPSGSVAAMRAAGLRQGYDTALETGFWPSEEILPKEMRRSASVGAR